MGGREGTVKEEEAGNLGWVLETVGEDKWIEVRIEVFERRKVKGGKRERGRRRRVVEGRVGEEEGKREEDEGVWKERGEEGRGEEKSCRRRRRG